MAEYIEREAAFNAITDLAGKAPTRSAYEAVWKSARALKKIPAADVAPVVHGRWVDGRCSNCGVDIPTDDAHDVIFGNECRFCYYCGAMMDGERKDGANG